MARRHAALLLAATLAMVAVLGTSGFSAASIDRSATVVVAEDPNAYLGLEVHNHTLKNGHHTVALLTMTNQVTTALPEINVDVNEPSKTPPNYKQGSVTEPDRLAVGESGEVTARVTCSNAKGRDEVWRLDITVIGADDSVVIRLTRPVRITCSGEPQKSSAGSGGR